MTISWLGLEIDGTEIEKQIGEGGFSVVYAGKKSDNGKTVAYKVARAEPEVLVEQFTGVFNTLAKAPTSVGMSDIEVRPNEVLRCQYDFLNSVDCPGLIKPLTGAEVAGLFYYTMPLVEGPTLRAKMQVTAYLERVARTCAKLAKLKKFHGDLKPDNIIISLAGPVLIDPGYFGTLYVNGVKVKGCTVTTPAYYPLFQQDDMLALGIILWEMVFGKQIFSVQGASRNSDLSRCGKQLVEKVKDLEAVSRYGFSSILDVQFPSQLKPELSPKAEYFLLRALRLKRTSANQLELEQGYTDFDEFGDMLKELKL